MLKCWDPKIKSHSYIWKKNTESALKGSDSWRSIQGENRQILCKELEKGTANLLNILNMKYQGWFLNYCFSNCFTNIKVLLHTTRYDYSSYLIWKYFRFSEDYYSINCFYPVVRVNRKTTEKPIIMIQVYRVYILLKSKRPVQKRNQVYFKDEYLRFSHNLK